MRFNAFFDLLPDPLLLFTCAAPSAQNAHGALRNQAGAKRFLQPLLSEMRIANRGTKVEPSWNQAIFATPPAPFACAAESEPSGTKLEPSWNQGVLQDVLCKMHIRTARPFSYLKF